MKFDFEVIVGNIGSVYLGNSEKRANETFDEYRDQSIGNYGRAAGEEVTLFEKGEITRSFTPVVVS